MTKRTLIYFAMRGRAEPIRLVLEELGLSYEDRGIASREAWLKLKPETPFGKMPLLEEDGVTIPESQAILRHLARAHDLYGKTERERTLADVAEGAFSQAEDDYWRLHWQKDSDAALAEYAAGPLAATLAQLERHFTAIGGDHWAGAALTFADFIAFKYLDQMATLHPKSLDTVPVLNAFVARIAERPRIAAYLSSGRRSRIMALGIKGPVFDPRGG